MSSIISTPIPHRLNEETQIRERTGFLCGVKVLISRATSPREATGNTAAVEESETVVVAGSVVFDLKKKKKKKGKHGLG